jgi:hypothetical protein
MPSESTPRARVQVGKRRAPLNVGCFLPVWVRMPTLDKAIDNIVPADKEFGFMGCTRLV